jgi:drug/metabolite transporter (DMT)-like permease
MDRRRAVLLLLITVVLWSTSGVMIKLSTLGPMALAGARSAVTALVLLAYIRRPRFTWSVYEIGGAVAMAATFFLFITATQLTSAANAILLQYTAPLWVALFGTWFLGERPRAYDWWAMAAIVAGMLLFFGGDLDGRGLAGNLLAVLSGLTMAWMTLLLRKQRGSAAETILLGNALTALIGLPFLLWESPQPQDWLIVLYMGVLQLGIPFVLYSVAIRYLPALDVILISTLEPILSPIWVFLAVGELPGALALLGGLVVILAVTVRSLVASGTLALGRTSGDPVRTPSEP